MTSRRTAWITAEEASPAGRRFFAVGGFSVVILVVIAFSLRPHPAHAQNKGYWLEQRMFERCAPRLSDEQVREFEGLASEDRLPWLEANCTGEERGGRDRAWEIYERCKPNLTPAQTQEFESSEWEARKRFIAKNCKEEATAVIEEEGAAKKTIVRATEESRPTEAPGKSSTGASPGGAGYFVPGTPAEEPPGYKGPRVAAHIFIWLGVDAIIAGAPMIGTYRINMAIALISAGGAFCIIGAIFAGVYSRRKDERTAWDRVHAGPVLSPDYAGFALSKRF